VGRQAALDAVAGIRPFDAEERSDRDDTIAWIESGAPIHRVAPPDVPPQHLVAYFALVDPVARATLLVDHRNAGLWLPPGGHVDPGEDPRDTVTREAAEELGIAAPLLGGLSSNPLLLTCTTTVGRDGGHLDVSLWYVLDVARERPLHPDPTEFTDVRWWPLDVARTMERADPHLPRFVAKLTAELDP
jgi:8-oxo-dGTP pyrophosphatase MutT (NUDIX family)